MTLIPHTPGDSRIAAAIAELTALVRGRYPAATFTVTDEDDPEGTYLTATVDVADTDEVIDLVIDSLSPFPANAEFPAPR